MTKKLSLIIATLGLFTITATAQCHKGTTDCKTKEKTNCKVEKKCEGKVKALCKKGHKCENRAKLHCIKK